MLMILVQPSVLTWREHGDDDEAGVNVTECQRVECQELAKLCLAVRTYHNHVLCANAILTGAIHRRLVAHHHACLQSHGVLLHTNALRAFMHVEAMANTMPGAMQVVDTGIPQRFTCQNI